MVLESSSRFVGNTRDVLLSCGQAATKYLGIFATDVTVTGDLEDPLNFVELVGKFNSFFTWAANQQLNKIGQGNEWESLDKRISLVFSKAFKSVTAKVTTVISPSGYIYTFKTIELFEKSEPVFDVTKELDVEITVEKENRKKTYSLAIEIE